MRVSVVVVSQNRAGLLRRCLEHLGAEHQVIVVDNGSRDGSPELEAEFPSARFICLPKNFGLTKALNIGIRSAEGEYLLLLHEDVAISAEAVTALADALEQQSDAGAVCPRLSGAPQIRNLPSPADPDPEWSPAAGSGDEDVEYASGAAIMVRRFLIQAMRNIDEHYGNYGSDADLCAQVSRRAGKKVRIVSAAPALHTPEPRQSSLLVADRIVGTSVFLGKYYGAGAGWKYRVVSALKAALTFRFGVLKHLLTGQKVDGTQAG